MSAAVRAELLKVRTTRSWWGYLVVVVLLSALAGAGTIGSALEDERSTVDWQATLADGIGFASLVALILGITVATGEFRHGTITPTLLARPDRERVLAAKAVAVLLLSLLFAVLAAAIVAAISLVWLPLVDAELHLADGDVLQRVLSVSLAVLLFGLIGLAIGAVVHGQIAAIVGTLVWILVVESLLIGLFMLLDVERVRGYLPFQALDAADGTGGGELLGYGAGLAVSLLYIAAIGALGLLRTSRRDIT